MKYFIIYPDGNLQKLENFKKNNQHLNIEIFPIEAPFSDKNLRDTLLKDKVITADNQYDLSNLALAKAHIELWKQAVETDCSITVFEVNTVTHKDFVSYQKQSLSLKNYYDLVIFGYNLNWNSCLELIPCLPKVIYTFPGYGKEDLKKPNNDLINVSVYQNSNIDTIQTLKAFSFANLGCYTISPKGAKYLLEQINAIGNQSAPSYQDHPHGTNFYVFTPIAHRENISLDIEVNRHIDKMNTYMTIPMLAVIHTDIQDKS